MSLKQNLNTYSPLELKELIKEHNKRVRGMVKEEVKQFRKEKLNELIIRAVGKKEELIDRMVKIANKKDVSSFKLIKKKGKTTDEQKETLDKIHKKEVKQLYKDFSEGKIDKKKLNKELSEIKKERVRAEMPKLKIVEGEKKQEIPKITITEAPKKIIKKEKKSEPVPKLEKKEFKIKLPEEQAKQAEKPKGKRPAKKAEEEQAKQAEAGEAEEFQLPKFFKTAPANIQDNIKKGVKDNKLSSNPNILKQEYKGAKLIKKGLNTGKSAVERIEGLSRGMTAINDEKDQEIYKAVFNEKIPKKKIESEFLKIGVDLMTGDKDDKKAFRPHLSKQPLEVQKKFLRKNREAYLATVVSLNDKTGESKKEADKVTRAMEKQKAQREAEFKQAKKEQQNKN